MGKSGGPNKVDLVAKWLDLVGKFLGLVASLLFMGFAIYYLSSGRAARASDRESMTFYVLFRMALT